MHLESHAYEKSGWFSLECAFSTTCAREISGLADVVEGTAHQRLKPRGLAIRYGTAEALPTGRQAVP